MVMCPGADGENDSTGWGFREWAESLAPLRKWPPVVACVGGNSRWKLGTVGRWEVERVPFWLSNFSVKSEVGISAGTW